jgi:colanic acid biosynthesis protein WcaH
MIIPEDIYSHIVCLMPIPCVDIIVEDERGRVLLIKRADEPAKGQWWFPGGRIHYLETRTQAVVRKLREECELEPASFTELGTYDVILDMPDGAASRHGITTLYHVTVKNQEFILNEWSLEADWRLPEEWKTASLHQFVRENLNRM